jgi:hypothetical protein
MSLEYFTWDNRLLRSGVEVSPRATITEIIAAAQLRTEEALEDASRYALYSGEKLAIPPCTRGQYIFRPKVQVADSVIVKFRGGEMTVAVPIFHPDQWQRIVHEAMPSPPLSVVQSGPKEFTACYEDEIRTWKVLFIQDGEGEDHDIRMSPQWENQIILVREAFAREMILDTAKPVKNGVIHVKSADGSPRIPHLNEL